MIKNKIKPGLVNNKKRNKVLNTKPVIKKKVINVLNKQEIDLTELEIESRKIHYGYFNEHREFN